MGDTLANVSRKVGAGLILLLIAAVILKFAIGILAGLFWAVLGVVLVVAAVWALNQIL